MQKKLLFVFIIILLYENVLCQTITKSKSIFINSNEFHDTIIMNGTLDGFNTFTKKYDVQLWTSKSERVFEPMEFIKIQNNDSLRVYSPRLIFNNTGNWYDPVSMASEAVKGAESAVDTVLSLMYFIYNNRFSYMLPNIDSYYGLKLLTIYGYGSCDLASYNVRLLSLALGLLEKPHPMPHHTVSETIIGNKSFLIDSDFRIFYLLYDNHTIASYDDILKDKYIIRRTKHFGENIIYLKSQDDYISRIYYNDFSNELKGVNPSLFSTNFDYCLRPSESIYFSWDIPIYYHQDWLEYKDVTESLLKNVIANGSFELSNDFNDYNPREIFDSIYGLNYFKNNNFSGLTAETAYSIATISYNSPFPVHDLQLGAKFLIENENDSVEIFFNLVDSDTERIKIASIKDPGITDIDTNLRQYLKVSEYRQVMPFTYKYVLTFVFYKTDSASFMGLDSIYLKNTFQISKKFLPTLRLGKNDVNYSDSGGNPTRNLKVDIKWKESYENRPPFPPLVPVFPLDKYDIDSLYFSFIWEPATDPDGDEIADYEFFLSNRPDMKFPLSPNFSQYVSAFNTGNILPMFKVKETGWLNDGEIYYWRVRAKDSRGAWGEWSPTWTFIPHGVMQPVDLKINPSFDGIGLSWRKNLSGKDPDFYKIYASNESEGFTPSETNLIATTTDTSFFLKFVPGKLIYSFYRVSACSMDGQESLPSEYVELNSPFIFFYADTVTPDVEFNAQFLVNKKERIMYYYKYDTIEYNYDISIKEKPEWIKFEKENQLSGFPTREIARKIIFNEDLSKIIITVKDSSKNEIDYSFILNSSELNNKPLIAIANNNFKSGEIQSSFINTIDGDIYFGDKHFYNVSEAPAWLSFFQINDTLFFEGLPQDTDAGRHNFTVTVTDSKMLTTLKEFYISVYKVGPVPVNIIPNPVTDHLNMLLEINFKSEVDLSVISLSGQLTSLNIHNVYEKGFYIIPLESNYLTSGVYILRARIYEIDNKNVKQYRIKFIKV